MEDFDNKKEKPKWGGKRENSGRAKGSLNTKTKEQKIIEEEFRQRVLNSMESLVNSQMNLAKGCQILFKISTSKDKDGKVVRSKPEIVKDQFEIEAYLAGDYDDSDKEYYFLTTEKPDNRALDSLIDRVFGKSINKTEITGKDGQPLPLLNYIVDNAIRDNNSDNKDTKDGEEDKGDTRGY